jgi:hypothetical protein
MSENTEKSKKAKWTLDGSTLMVKMPTEGVGAKFDMNELLPGFTEQSVTIQNTLVYGAKQRMSDACARSKNEKLTDVNAIVVMRTTWEELVSGKIWERKTSKGVERMSEDDKKVKSALKNINLAQIIMLAGINQGALLLDSHKKALREVTDPEDIEKIEDALGEKFLTEGQLKILEESGNEEEENEE